MDRSGSDSLVSSSSDAHTRLSRRQGTVVERLSRYGMQVMPSAFQRRSRVQKMHEVSGSAGGAQQRDSSTESPTQSVRKKYLKELRQSSNLGALSSQSGSAGDAEWALYPMEHAWMLSAVEGNYDTILEFISEDPYLLTRRDFISGYSVLHWLAKRGQGETLIQLLRYAESAGICVNVNLRGSGGLTPLHVASMHGQYMVVKLLVGAFGASVDVMDHSGRRAWQYLKEGAPAEMKELLGAWDEEHHCSQNRNNNASVREGNQTPMGEEEEKEEADSSDMEELKAFNLTVRDGWRQSSLRKLLSSFPFIGSKT
ncbi:hypothetical protein OJAV_G00103380 [Oryzias javanicus]|uniref:Uncharacterized protein n=1 Tax=Oryzias javanicus TaxID=123683 RepID=A0A437CXW5_ORYJA|nr:hypothetical protein OJAV_G00103380 [Oryzias javanicus]